MYPSSITRQITARSVPQRIMAFLAPVLADSSFHHTFGLTPKTLNVTTPARLTHTMFTKNKMKAPREAEKLPLPRSIPKTANGGSKATATITPMSELKAAEVNANAPTTPDDKARAYLPCLRESWKQSRGLYGQC